MYIHLTEIYNRNSIEQNGLTPSKIKLPNHLTFFKKKGLCTKDDKMIYTWSDCFENEKFIRDMVYIKIFGHARNELSINQNDYPPYIDFSKLGSTPIYKHNQMIFDIHLIDTNEEVYFAGIHLQTPDDSKTNSLHMMDEKYSHVNKKLYVSKQKLKTKVIGQALFYYDNSINIKVLR